MPLSAEQQKQLKQAAIDILIDDLLMRQFLRKQVEPPTALEVAKEIEDLKVALKKQNKTIEEFFRDSKQTPEQLRQDLQLESGGEERDLGHRLRDPVVERHGDGLAERHHAPFEKLVVVRDQGIGHQLLADPDIVKLVPSLVTQSPAAE